MGKSFSIDPIIKRKLKLDTLTDKEAIELIRKKHKFACKPCWELKYCLYGAIVEGYPILPPTLEEQLESNEIYKGFLSTDMFGKKPIEEERRLFLTEFLKNFNPDNYAKEILPDIKEMECNVFKHLCPVFFSEEDFAETSTA